MLAEVQHLGVDFWIEPIGLVDSRFQVVYHERFGRSTKCTKSVFNGSQEVLGCLLGDYFAIRFAAMAEHHSKHMSLSALALSIDTELPCQNRSEPLRLAKSPFAETVVRRIAKDF